MSAAARKRRRMRRTTPRLLDAYITRRADGASAALPCHWIHGANEIDAIECTEGDYFCLPCADAKVAEIFASHPDEAEEIGVSVDGGWSIEHDSIPRCDTCGAKLQGSLTDYGADEMIDVALQWDPQSADEWDDIGRAINTLDSSFDERPLVGMGCAARQKDELSGAIFDRSLRAWRRVAKVVRRVQRAAARS